MGQFRPKSTKFDRFWPKPAKIWPILAKIGQILADFILKVALEWLLLRIRQSAKKQAVVQGPNLEPWAWTISPKSSILTILVKIVKIDDFSQNRQN